MYSTFVDTITTRTNSSFRIAERIGAAILIGASLIIGLFPNLLLNVIVPSFNSPLFDWLRTGGAR